MVDIGACGSCGIAQETTAGTFAAPTVFFPIQNESLKFNLENKQRRGIRQVADPIGRILGNTFIDGSITMEFFDDIVPYFLCAARTNKVTTGSTNYTHVFTPAHCAGLGTGGKTLSITIVRGGTVEAYVGCQVASFEISVNEGVLMFTVNIIGLDEASQSDPTETYPSTLVPYGPGVYDIEIPAATDVNDVDTFTFSADDGLETQFRLRAVRSPAFLKYGERSSTLTLARDFASRTDYDAFKTGTSQAILLKASLGANNSVEISMPVAYKETYEFNLTGQADLIRAQISYFGTYDATTTGAYKITVKNQNAMA